MTRMLDANALSASSSMNPFLIRVLGTVETWIAREWHDLEALRKAAAQTGWSTPLRGQYDAAILNTENLAARLDKISSRKLRRELARLHAPPPGEIIRTARIAHARELLVSSRLLIREVAARAGYDSEKHFSEQFVKATGLTPSAYRRESTNSGDPVVGKSS